MNEDTKIEQRMREEEQVKEKIDEAGNRWLKLYFGGGAHFQNWIEQCEEIYGKANIEIEEVDPTGFRCYEEGNEKMYRIWARVGKDDCHRG